MSTGVFVIASRLGSPIGSPIGAQIGAHIDSRAGAQIQSRSGQFDAAPARNDSRLVAAVPPETLVKSALLTPAEQRSLVDRVRQGDTLAEEAIVLRFDRRIRALAVHRTRDREVA